MPKPQVRKSSLSTAERRKRELTAACFNKAIDKRNRCEPDPTKYPPGTPGRQGIIDFGEDANGNPIRVFYDHQVIAAQRVVEKSWRDPYTQRKGKGMLVLHAPGLGKTITGVGCMGAIDAGGTPFGRDEKHLVLVPKNVFGQWHKVIDKWIDCTSNFSD